MIMAFPTDTFAFTYVSTFEMMLYEFVEKMVDV